jgi:hypothetical protein
MNVLDEIRAAPGGGELANLADQLIGDPGAITATTNAWRTAAVRLPRISSAQVIAL